MFSVAPGNHTAPGIDSSAKEVVGGVTKATSKNVATAPQNSPGLRADHDWSSRKSVGSSNDAMPSDSSQRANFTTLACSISSFDGIHEGAGTDSVVTYPH